MEYWHNLKLLPLCPLLIKNYSNSAVCLTVWLAEFIDEEIFS